MTKGKYRKYRSFLINNFNREANNSFYPYREDCTLEIIKEVFCNTNEESFFEEDTHLPETKRTKKYFNITKIKKRGKRRIKASSKVHDKNSQYNKICKIKVYFTKSLLEQANNLYKGYLNKEEAIKVEYLKQINQKEEKDENNLNIDWFYKTVKEYLSSNLSGKYSILSKDYNKNKIEKIYKESEMKNLICFLDQSICSVYNEYINDKENQNEIFKGMRKIDTDLKNLKIKFNYDDEYIKELKKTAINLGKIFLDKKNNKEKMN